MPILTLIYIVTATALFGSGYFVGWNGEYKEIVRLELQLNDINTKSQKLLSDTKQHNDELAVQQQEQIAELENKYYETIRNNDNLHDQLADAQRLHRTATSATRDCRAVSKADNPARGEKTDAGGRPEREADTAGFSERLDTFVSGKAREADKLDAERRLLLDWVKTIERTL